MNDLTKKQHKDIMSWANVYTEFGQSWTYKLHKPLMDKVLSLIDNYCEHDDMQYNSGEYSYCNKCGIKE